MFHILIENSNPDKLVGGPWGSSRDSKSNVLPSIVECGLKGGQIREAIPSQRFKSLLNSGKLKRDRACKKCLQKTGGRYSGKRETETSDTTARNTN